MTQFVIMAAAVLAITAHPAMAQTDQENAVFDQTVQAFAGSGRGRIYQCKGPSGQFSSEDQHLPELTRIAKAMAAGDEVDIARTSGCRQSNDAGPTKAFSGTKLLGMAARTADTVWLIGEVTESYPQATGYTFEAIVRIPLASSAVRPAAVRPVAETRGETSLTAAAAAEADRDYMKRDGTRKMAGTDEGSGYDVCPSSAEVDIVLDAGGVAPLDIRDERMAEVLKRRGCKQGNKLLTNIRPRRFVQSFGTFWYGAKGVEAGRPVDVLVWMN